MEHQDPPSERTQTETPPASARRIGVVLGLIGLALASLLGRVAYLQTTFAREAGPWAARQHDATQTLHARRGSVFDRNGLLLAASEQSTLLFADPKVMHERFAATGRSLGEMDSALEDVARLVRVDPDRAVLAVGRDPDKQYVPLAGDLSESTAASVREMDVPGLGLAPQPRRVYPMGTTAAHLLGAVGRDEAGLEGVERTAESTLAGDDGAKVTIRDKRRRVVAADAAGYALPRHGDHLVLALDARLQTIAEEELARQVAETNAKGGSVVLMDPQTGDVLALANLPTYFPQYVADSRPADRRNRAAVDPYEPGSVVKPFLVAGLIDAGVTRVDEQIEIGDSRVYRTPYGRRITDTRHYADRLAVWDVLVKSSNVGMVKLGERVGGSLLQGVLGRFGFGQAPGLGVGFEEPGRVPGPATWGKYTRESVMQGYEMLATPVQLARAMCAIANGGRLVRPRVVRGIYEPGGRTVLSVGADAGEQVMRPETAAILRRAMSDVTTRGTARRAKMDSYTLFGKTGTSHKAVDGGYNETAYNATFLGGAPHESPRLVICVTIDEPDKSLEKGQGHFGGVAAAPAAGRILARSLEMMGVPPSPPLPDPPPGVAEVLYNFKSSTPPPDAD